MKKFVLAAGLAVGLGSVAFAAGPAFEDVDANNDGQISRDEAVAIEGIDFAAADLDANGSLSRSELSAAGHGGAVDPSDDLEPGGALTDDEPGMPGGMTGDTPGGTID